MTTAAGDLRQRFAFSSRQTSDDGMGNTQGSWAAQFTVWARRVMMRGGEAVMASRLAGRDPAIVTVRSTTQTRLIKTDWRCTDENTGDIFNIRSVTPGEKPAYIDLLCERGVADG